jgi:hypothetical protein
MNMIRVRTLIAAALLTIPVLSLSAATPADLSTSVMRESKLPTPTTNACYWIAGHWWCF